MSLLSVDVITGSTIIPFIPHVEGSFYYFYFNIILFFIFILYCKNIFILYCKNILILILYCKIISCQFIEWAVSCDTCCQQKERIHFTSDKGTSHLCFPLKWLQWDVALYSSPRLWQLTRFDTRLSFESLKVSKLRSMDPLSLCNVKSSTSEVSSGASSSSCTLKCKDSISFLITFAITIA